MIEQYYKLHMEGQSMTAISKKFKLSRKILSKEFKLRGFKIFKGNEVIINHKTLIKLNNKHLKGDSLLLLGQSINVDARTLAERFRRFDLKVLKNRYKIIKNETYFDKINSEFKAYFLGFFMADGCNCNNTLKIKLHKKDAHILKSFSMEILNKDATLQYGDHVTLKIGSKYLSERFNVLGIYPDKSHKEIFIPKEISKNLIRHFIRGFFDGDGWIVYIKSKQCHVGFCSNSKKFLQEINLVLSEKLNLNLKTIKKDPNSNCYRLVYSSLKDCLKFKNYFYKYSNFYLKRKFKIFKNVYTNTVLT